MPEGPEVETIRRNLIERLRNQEIESIWRSDLALRTPTNSHSFEFLRSDRITSLSRLGKILIVETNRERGLLVRFGMSGRLFFPKASDVVEKHTHLRVRFRNNEHELRYIDPRRFGDLQPYRNLKEKEELLSGTGQDGISLTKSEATQLAKRIRLSHRPIKAVLLDQSILSGVGNIYACEALYIAHISPLRLASELSLTTVESILNACSQVMNEAASNGGTTFLSYLDGNGQKGANQSRLRVFARDNKPCYSCGENIVRVVQSGRSTFYCSHCQI